MHLPSYPYKVYRPANGPDTERKWPLIVFLHGAGERGDNFAKVEMQGLPKMLLQKDIPFVVAYPQCPLRSYWSVELLNIWLDEVLEKEKSKIDLKRIYLTGLSMGGYGTWHWAAASPNRFAAIAPVCGGGNPATAYRLVHLPIWAFHGAKDDIVPLSESVTMVEAVKKMGGKVEFTVYPDAAHDSWTETYHNAALYDWFLNYSRNA